MMNNEDAETLKQFSQELASLYDLKPPISKAKMVQLTKIAMKGIRFYKHVVMAVEKFIHRCKPEYKLPGLYVIDSIVRQSRHQYGTDKDVFAPRFCKNLENTLQAAASFCADEDKQRVARIMNLWVQNGVFPEEIISPIVNDFKNMDVMVPSSQESLDKSRKSKEIVSPIIVEKVMKRKSDDSNSAPNSKSSTNQKQAPPPAPTPSSNPEKLKNMDTNLLQQIQKLTSTLMTQQQGVKKPKSASAVDSERKLTKKILSQYDYSDDEGEEMDEGDDDESGEEEGEIPAKLEPTNKADISRNLAHAAQNLLNNPQILQQIQKMQQSITRQSSVDSHQAHIATMAAPQAVPPPPPVPAPRPTAQPFDFSMPPPFPPIHKGMGGQNILDHGMAPSNAARSLYDNQTYPPPAEPLPPGFDADRREDRDERRRLPFQTPGAPSDLSESSSRRSSSRRKSSRDRSRSRSRDRKRKHRSSRSRTHSPRDAGPSHNTVHATAYSKRHRNSDVGGGGETANVSGGGDKKDDHERRSRRSRSRSHDRRDKEKERRNRGMLSSVKPKHFSIYSRTLWFGRVPATCVVDEIKEALKDYGEPVSIDLIPPRGCAYVLMADRKSAYKVLDRLKDLKIQNRTLKMAWAMGKGVKNDFEDNWDTEFGVTYISWDKLKGAPPHIDLLTQWAEGGTLDVDSLPDDLKPLYNEKGRIGLTPQQPQALVGLPTAPMMPGLPPGITLPPGAMFPGMMPPGYSPMAMAQHAGMLFQTTGQLPPSFVMPPPPPPTGANQNAPTGFIRHPATFQQGALNVPPPPMFMQAAMGTAGQNQATHAMHLPGQLNPTGMSPQRAILQPQSLMTRNFNMPPGLAPRPTMQRLDDGRFSRPQQEPQRRPSQDNYQDNRDRSNQNRFGNNNGGRQFGGSPRGGGGRGSGQYGGRGSRFDGQSRFGHRRNYDDESQHEDRYDHSDRRRSDDADTQDYESRAFAQPPRSADPQRTDQLGYPFNKFKPASNKSPTKVTSSIVIPIAASLSSNNAEKSGNDVIIDKSAADKVAVVAAEAPPPAAVTTAEAEKPTE